MIALQITGRNYELDDKIRDYVDRKIGALDRFLPKKAPAITGEVILQKDNSNRENNSFVCEVLLDIPGERFQAQEGTMNMYAAVDIVEQKLKQQILTYKSKHEPARNRRRMLFGKMFGRDQATNPDLVEEQS